MIEKIILKNWKSHHETEVEFEEGVNALIGTMGSGKSSVLEGIVFALYGTTPSHNSRDITLDDLIRRSPSKAEKAELELFFSVDGESYSVKREIERDKGTTRSEFRKDGELIEAPSTREVTEQVEQTIGLGFKSFTRAIYSEQNNLDLFLNMRPGDRKEKIDELLDIDRFEDARKTMVKVENNLKRELESKQKELEELDEEIDEEEIDELEDEIEEKKEQLKEMKQQRENLEEEIEKRAEKKEKLEESKEKADKLEEKLTRLDTKKENAQDELEEAEEKLEGIEDPEEEKKKAEQDLEELEETEDKIKRLKQEIDHLEEGIEKRAEKIEELEEQAEKYQKLEEIEEEIEELEERLEKIREKGNSRHAERQTLEESLETLRDAEGDCPTCGKEMDDQHREELVEKREKRINELKEEEKELRQKHDKKDDNLDELKEKRDKLLEYRSAEDRLEEKREEQEEKTEELDEKQDNLEELEEAFSEEDVEKLEERLERLSFHEQKEEAEERLEKIDEMVEETEEELEEIDFSEEKLESIREEISERKEKRSALKQKLKSGKELIQEKEKRLDQLRTQLEKKQELSSEVERLDEVLDFAFEYRTGLEETQVDLREMFVETLNRKMDSIWSQVYPYDDYYSIRLNAEEDYLVEVLDSENNWVSAEAEVSGGERHSAALVMRLALTFTLSPKLPTLMLDEPTHNMDSSGVEELAETLRKNSSDLIRQLFIVTHDPSLESAATGKLYRFEKKNTENGISEVEEIK